MANPRYYDTIGIPPDEKIEFSFLSLIRKEDVPLVERMFGRLPTEQTVNDFQFGITNRSGKVFDVESNAKCIYKDNKLVGFQMVIRDITVRKRLEGELLESYKKVQSARNATILGLAKLAEYRDADTGHTSNGYVSIRRSWPRSSRQSPSIRRTSHRTISRTSTTLPFFTISGRWGSRIPYS
jgi:PAS domain S-box-containing protein